METGSERRTEKRVWLKMPVTITNVLGPRGNYTAPAETINVSRHGACLITDCEIEVGEFLALQTSGMDEPSAIPGHVTWRETVGIRHRIGVQFDVEPDNWIIV